MQKENLHYNIQPADRLSQVSEYYFSRKLKEVARMNAEGKDVISLGIGSPDMPSFGRNSQSVVRECTEAGCTRLPAYSGYS